MARASPRFGMIADDLTGACDAGVQFVRHGFSTVVWLAGPEPEAADVLVLPTHSRNDSPELARSKVERACRRVLERGRELAYKKIDSTLCGNIGPEIEAALAVWLEREAWVAPAFPAMGRTVAAGWLHVDGIRRQDVRALLASCAGARALDAESQRDLARIAGEAFERKPAPLLVGSAGLAMEVAALLAQQCGKSPAVPPGPPPRKGPVVFAIGSTNPVTAAQARYLTAHRPEAAPHLFSVARDAPDVSLLLARLAATPPRALVLTGGDTACLVCSALEARAIRLEREIRTGIPCGTLSGGVLDGVPVVTKAGGFGAEDALAVAWDSL